jgi:hypothetical protein
MFVPNAELRMLMTPLITPVALWLPARAGYSRNKATNRPVDAVSTSPFYSLGSHLNDSKCFVWIFRLPGFLFSRVERLY